jgi:hypothetical protein
MQKSNTIKVVKGCTVSRISLATNVPAALRRQGIKKQKIIMSTQVDLFTNVDGLQVSPAFAKLPVMP